MAINDGGVFTNRGKFQFLKGATQQTGLPTAFSVMLVTGKNEVTLDNSPAVDRSGTPNLVGIPVTGHGFPDSALITLTGTVAYNGSYLVDPTSTINEVRIVSTYTPESFTGAELIHEAPGPLTNSMADLVEIPAGNGYTSGGIAVARDAVDFDVATEDDVNHIAFVQLIDIQWTASGGDLPVSGKGARYAVLGDDNVTVSSREVYVTWDLLSYRTVSDMQPLTLVDLQLDYVTV